MADSLVINNTIELLGGGVQSTLAQCVGATFRLAPNWDLSAPQPEVDLLAVLAVDGEQPRGRRSSNRVPTMDIVIQAPNRLILAGAKEALAAAIDAQQWQLKWTRDPADNPGGLPLPVVFDCFRAGPSVPTYSLVKEKNNEAEVTITFQAQPYGKSDTQQTLTFASAVTGSTPPPAPVPLDAYGSVSGTNFSQSTQHIIGPNSAHWNSGSGGVPSYTKSFTAVDITGRGALSLWIGLGSSNFYGWHQGNVVFNLTLKDTGGHVANIGLTQYCNASNNPAAPTWQQITAQIPTVAGFDYAHVNGYTFTCYSSSTWFSGPQMQADVYLDALTATTTTTGVPASSRGAIANLFGIGTARAAVNFQFQMAPVSVPQSTTYSSAGAITPFIPDAGVTVLTVEKWAGSAAGGSRTTSGQASGSKGGEYTKNTAFPCTPGVAIAGFVGAGGVASATAPTDGGDTWFGVNDSTAAHGSVAPAVNVSGAVNTAHGVSTDPTHNAGGAPAGGATTGGGGGEAGGPAGAGNAGGNPAGGTGHANAGDGGAGGAAGNNVGQPGVAPGGGAGGASSTGTTELGGAGAVGQIIVSWTEVLAPFGQLIAHRPGPDAPQNLCPFVSVGNGSDTPNGATEYAVPSLVAGTLADFGGTYSLVLVNFSFSGAGSRTVTVTIKQYEFAGGPAYSFAVARTFVPADITGGIIDIGEITLPGVDVAPDNTQGFYTVTITDTTTADRYLDLLMLDSMGQTIKWNTTGPTYKNLWIDEPDPNRSTGRVMGSAFDRSAAVSVLNACDISGGPPTISPGTQILLMYSPTGAPACVASYAPRWQFDRYA